MTREEILKELKILKEKGLSFKYIAAETGLKPQDIYDFAREYTNTHKKLEEYLTKLKEEK